MEVKGNCKDCIFFNLNIKLCERIKIKVENKDYCSYFKNKEIILPSCNKKYFYISESGKLINSAKIQNCIAYFNYDLSYPAILIRAQEQFINNKLHKLAEKLNGNWIPNFRNVEEKKYYIRYWINWECNDVECKIEYTKDKKDENKIYFKSINFADVSWNWIKDDLFHLYCLKSKMLDGGK